MLDHVGVAAPERRDGRALPAQHHGDALVGEDLGGEVDVADCQCPVEGPGAVAAGEVQANGAADGPPRPRHVDTSGREPPPHDLGQQRVDAVVDVVLRADAADQQPGGLEAGEHVVRTDVVGEQRCRRG